MNLEKGLNAVFARDAANSRLFLRVASGLWAVVHVWNVGWKMSPVVPCAVQVGQRFALRGFEELTSFFRMVEGPPTVASQSMATASQQVVIDTDSDDFEDLPSFHAPQHSTPANRSN